MPSILKKYIFSFYGIIDIVSILPFYLHFGLGFSSLRALHIFRIFRALKIVRYNKAIKRFGVAFSIIREEIILFAILTGIILYMIAAGIYYFEHAAQPKLFTSIFHSLWWAIVTLTTVGYGDVYPITLGGRIFTFFVLLIGVSLMTIPAGIFTTALMKAREMEEEEKRLAEQKEMEEDILEEKRRIKIHFLFEQYSNERLLQNKLQSYSSQVFHW